MHVLQNMALNCYGCGERFTSPERYNLYTPSHLKVLLMWKRLVSDRLKEMEHTIDVNEFLDKDDGSTGRICRKCYFSLEKFEKLESTIRPKIGNAVDTILKENRWLGTCRKRTIDDDDNDDDNNDDDHGPITTLPCNEPSTPIRLADVPPTNTSTSASPDVAVSYTCRPTCIIN